MSSTPKLACILAAGLGVRLGPRGELTPKGFLTMTDRPIIEESYQKLIAAGIERLIVVTGHLPEHYQEWASRHAESVTLVHNAEFSESGSLYSFWCARKELTEPFLLLESDLIYESRALHACLQDERESLILLSGFTNAGDEIYVETEGINLKNMSKCRDDLGQSIMGEFVGINKISLDLKDKVMRYAEREFEANLRLDYETDGLLASTQQKNLPCLLVPDLIWSEIDTAEHLKRAREEVYPKIEFAESGHPRAKGT